MLSHFRLSLLLIFWGITIGVKASVEDSLCLGVTDRRLTSEMMERVSARDLWTAIRTLDASTYDNPEILIDGVRMPKTALIGITVGEVAEVRIIRDAAKLAQLGIHGGKGAVEIVTKKYAKGPLSLSYKADIQAGKPADGSKGTMKGAEHWLTADGGDDNVGYRFTAIYDPGTDTKTKGTDRIQMRSYIGYRRNALAISNDLQYGNYGIHETFNDDDTDKTRFSTLTDRIRATLSLMPGLEMVGYFSFLRQEVRRDVFLSPYSPVFKDEDNLRNKGTYDIMRETTMTYDGGLKLAYQKAMTGGHTLIASAGVSLYSGERGGESYAGRGILNDILNYVSFTQTYDTLRKPTAVRDFERTLQCMANVGYDYQGRYSATMNVTMNRSSLLSPKHRNEVYWAADLGWNISREAWMAESGIDCLRLSLGLGRSATVPYSYKAFTPMYSNITNETYIYNYYQTGAQLQGYYNENIRPDAVTRGLLSLDFETKGWHLNASGMRAESMNMVYGDVGKTLKGKDWTAIATLSAAYDDVREMLAGMVIYGQWHRWTASASFFTDNWETNRLQSIQIGYMLPSLWRFIKGGMVRLSGEENCHRACLTVEARF